MTSDSLDDSEEDARLNGILAEFIQQTEAGQNPDPQKILARHPGVCCGTPRVLSRQGPIRVHGRAVQARR